MVTATGSVIKILDFGLARLVRRPDDPATPGRPAPTAAPGGGSNPFVLPDQVRDPEGALMGTLQYIAPEQCSTPNVDIRADIYSLGCTFYYRLAGIPPFTSQGAPYTLIEAHQSQEPVPIETHRPEIPVVWRLSSSG